MAVFGVNEAKVAMPREIVDGIVTKTLSTSLVAKLSGASPMRFGEADIITFNEMPRMEYVGEGAEKSPTNASLGTVTAKPYKGQVTMRFNEEVQWADEDYQLGLLREIAKAGQVALSRGLDLGLLHRINPLTGQAITSWDNYLGAATKSVVLEAKKDPDEALRQAIGTLVSQGDSWPVTGVAMDPSFAWGLASLKDKDGRQRYPNIGFGVGMSNFLGLPVEVGSTVSGTPEAAKDTGLRAIVGDFASGIRWGVQRNLPVEIIRFGDPDGQGDLKRKNQIALRLEIVYGWHVFTDRFAIVKAPTTTSAAG